ncbi:polycystin 1L2 [Paragonimus westermani]|uniref:Polycystin 1L2 n=1 Tax=Paragonimus westermani TaxID=34504 RepID=A0A5J4P2U0_9TREM|nr:polycystin 1L2 [Paragonimus westermani]
MVPNTADSMIMTSATVNAVLKNREDMDRQSQSRLTEMLGGYAVSLPIVLAQHDITKRQEVIAQVVDNAVHLVGISVSQKNDSVPKDIERNPKLLDYNVDLEGPGLKGSEDIWRELSLQNSAADQSKVASSASNVLASLLQTHSGLLQTTLIEDNTPTVTTTSSAVLGLHKLGSAKNISVTMPANKHGSSATVPDLCSTVQKIGIDCHLPLTVQSLTSDFNMFAFVNPASSSIPVPPECNTVTLSIYNDTNQISLENTDKPFEILLRKSPRFVPPAFAALDESAKDAKLPASRIAADNSIVYQALLVSEITLPDSNSGVTFQLMPRNLSGCPQYLVVGRMIEPPVISRVGGKFDFWGTIPMDTKQCDQMQVDPDELNYPYTFFVNNTQLTKAKSTAISALGDRKLSPEALQKVYVGFRELNDQERNKYNPDNPPPMPYPFRDQINSTATSRIFISSCMSTNTERPTSWSSAGCDVGPETTVKQTQCFCYHLSTFAAGYLHSPNKLDFDYIFANMDFEKNPTLYGTEIAIFLLFLPLFIWARRKDVKDMEKLGVTPLAENNPNDDYLYEIIVSTGRRRGAGTDSKVCFMLSGEYGETEAKVLADPCRKVLQRGNCDRFLLACPRPLGKLIYCRLWHDNSGKDDRASWYCNYLGVVDLQTREKSHFIVGRWFAVDEEDGQIDRLIPVSNQEEMMALSHMFATSISRDLSDEHLWVSVVARPASSRFTRVERVACCLLLLFLSMLSSCMFYQKEGAIKQPDLFTMGPFAFTAQEMFVAVINNLITFVPLFVVTYLFRNSRLYTSHAKLLREAVERHLDETIDIGQCSIGLDEKKASDKRVRFASSDGGSSATEITVSNKRKGSRSCPWQMRILTWIILILSLATAATFTTFYGVSFGNAACQKWLSSMFLSFFTSLLLVQPLKVVLLAVFLSLMCKRMDRVDEIDILEEENALIYELGKRYQLQMDEEYLHNEYLMSNFKPKRMVILPPDPDALDKIRIYRMKQRRANDIIREIFFYVIFLCLLFTVTLEFRDPFGFPLRQNIEDSFFGDDFTKMHSVDDFYAWINYTLIPKLRAKRWYNQGPPVFQRGFLEDRVNRIIGYGLMRQLRVKPNSCNVYSSAKPLIKNCYDTYDMFTQDEQAYGVGWIPFQGDSRHNNSMREFQYTSTSVLGGVPYRGKMGWYSGGGYVHMFRGSEEEMLNNLHFLRSKHWIEFGTRAIIVQFTAYNPNVNLFAIVTALVELPGLGTVIPSHRIETANLFGTAGSHVTTVEIGFQVAYVVALLGYMFKEAHNLYKQRCQYFKDIWNFVELFIMFGSFAAIAAYAYMIFATKEAIAEFSRTHGNVFMNFQFLAYWNETLTYLLAVICFFATLKLVRLFRFNRRIGLLGSVLRYAARDLKYFMIIFFLLFIAFVLVFYLLYEGTLADFRSFLGSVETSLQIILGKFDFTSMYERELVLGPLMFAVFTLCIIFIVVSMFVAILEESFGKVMQDIRLQSDDHEITQFILAQLIAWSGLNRTGWGKKLMGPIDTAQEPVYQEHSERELSHKLTELNRLMDEFLGYVQLNYLADLDTKSKKPATEM